MPRFAITLHFDAADMEDAQDHVQGMENHLETFEPPTWVETGPIPVPGPRKACPPCGRGNHEWCHVKDCHCAVIHPGHAERRYFYAKDHGLPLPDDGVKDSPGDDLERGAQ
jgi:hypothetical protein